MLLPQRLYLIFCLDVLPVELALNCCLVNVVLLKLANLALPVTGLVLQLLQLSSGQLALGVLLLNCSLKTGLLIVQLAHFGHCPVLLPNQVVQLFLDLRLSPLVLPQLLLNLENILFQTFESALDSALLCINCPQPLVIF